LRANAKFGAKSASLNVAGRKRTQVRIGIDLVEIERLAGLVEKYPAFARRTFSSRELEAAARMRRKRRGEYLAGRFAVKEAVLKAVGTGLSGDLRLTEIETTALASGAPRLALSGRALKRAQRDGIRELYVSISHESRFAIAFVILLPDTKVVGGRGFLHRNIDRGAVQRLR
jgi:holo-[acyl-carrier protein] synthase